jgi:hypothetical protein
MSWVLSMHHFAPIQRVSVKFYVYCAQQNSQANYILIYNDQVQPIIYINFRFNLIMLFKRAGSTKNGRPP